MSWGFIESLHITSASCAPSALFKMATLLKSFIALMAIAALADVAMCANYTVGAPTGSWDLTTNYEEWVKAIKFYPGDFLSKYYNIHMIFCDFCACVLESMCHYSVKHIMHNSNYSDIRRNANSCKVGL